MAASPGFLPLPSWSRFVYFSFLLPFLYFKADGPALGGGGRKASHGPAPGDRLPFGLEAEGGAAGCLSSAAADPCPPHTCPRSSWAGRAGGRVARREPERGRGWRLREGLCAPSRPRPSGAQPGWPGRGGGGGLQAEEEEDLGHRASPSLSRRPPWEAAGPGLPMGWWEHSGPTSLNRPGKAMLTPPPSS